MNARNVIAAGSFLVLSACYATRHADDDVSLRGARPQVTIESDASSSALSPSADAAMDATDPSLQVWLGAVHREEGVGLACGPSADGSATEERALLLLELDAHGELQAGSLTLGEGPPLPPVKDPDAYYPPAPFWDWHGCPMLALVPGFEYAVHDARLAQGRLTASIHPADVVKDWCELQPSYRASPPAAAQWGEYLCRPTDQFQDINSLNDAIPDPARNTPEMPPFVPEELCFNVNAPCLCDADSCTASPYGAFHLDVQLAGKSFSGRFGRMDITLERRQ